MKYVYPAILYADDGKMGVTVPDLPGCHTYGENIADALIMAKDAIEGWLCHAEDNGWDIPSVSETLPIRENETMTLIVADTTDLRQGLRQYLKIAE